MASGRQPALPALKEFVMRYFPAAAALSLLAGVTASVGWGADREADPLAQALIAQGRVALEAGNTQEAIDSFEAALSVDPAYEPIYLDLAEASRREGLQGKAIHYYRETLERDPRNFAALSGEGEALLEKGAVEKARAKLDELRSLCGEGCTETRELAAALEQGPPVMTAEVAPVEGLVVQK